MFRWCFAPTKVAISLLKTLVYRFRWNIRFTHKSNHLALIVPWKFSQLRSSVDNLKIIYIIITNVILCQLMVLFIRVSSHNNILPLKVDKPDVFHWFFTKELPADSDSRNFVYFTVELLFFLAKYIYVKQFNASWIAKTCAMLLLPRRKQT